MQRRPASARYALVDAEAESFEIIDQGRKSLLAGGAEKWSNSTCLRYKGDKKCSMRTFIKSATRFQYGGELFNYRTARIDSGFVRHRLLSYDKTFPPRIIIDLTVLSFRIKTPTHQCLQIIIIMNGPLGAASGSVFVHIPDIDESPESISSIRRQPCSMSSKC